MVEGGLGWLVVELGGYLVGDGGGDGDVGALWGQKGGGPGSWKSSWIDGLADGDDDFGMWLRALVLVLGKKIVVVGIVG